jgi:glutathione S-transferase
VANRQKALEKHKATNPDHPFYPLKTAKNGALHKLYETDLSPAHEEFFATTQEMYRKFAAGMNELEELVVLPYAAGDDVTLADLHIVPWLSHAMANVGTTDPLDLDKLEKHIQKTVPEFKIGPKTREWCGNFVKRESFREVSKVLH